MNILLSGYIKPELLILVPVLYAAGSLLKRSRINDYNIPYILGMIGIILSTIWLLSGCENWTIRCVLSNIFAGVTQGILTAGASVYLDQLIKQWQEGQECRACEAQKKRKAQENAGDAVQRPIQKQPKKKGK